CSEPDPNVRRSGRKSCLLRGLGLRDRRFPRVSKETSSSALTPAEYDTHNNMYFIKKQVRPENRAVISCIHMAIHESIKASIPDAMRAKDEVKLRTLRSLVTAMTNEVVAKKRKPDEFLTDEEATVVLKRASNQRKDSIEQFTKANRMDLAEPEEAELAIIEALLPAQMSREEIETVVKAKMAETGVSSKADAGKFTGAVM